MSDAVTDALIQLDNQLEEAGWEQPARFLVAPKALMDVTDFVEITGHPCDVLLDLWEKGVFVEEGATGLALTVEGLRHLRVDEIRNERPEVYAQLIDIAADSYEESDLDKVEEAAAAAWLATIADESPLAMPPELTKRVRNTIVVLHTGWTHGVVRDQGGDPEVLDSVPPERLELSRVPHFMWLFLTGQKPTD